VTSTALKHQTARADDVVEAVTWMKRLNKSAGRLALESGVRAATDVTGFGLIGHLSEMIESSHVGAELFLGGVPLLAGARRYAEAQEVPGGTRDNREHFEGKVSFDDGVPEVDRLLLFDAQTSGGLLLSVPPNCLPGFLTQAVLEDVPHWPLGRIVDGGRIDVRLGRLEDSGMPGLRQG
jgi:selenide,water dikinase